MEWILRMLLSLAATILSHLRGSGYKDVYEAVEAAIDVGRAALRGNLTRYKLENMRKEFNEAVDFIETLM